MPIRVVFNHIPKVRMNLERFALDQVARSAAELDFDVKNLMRTSTPSGRIYGNHQASAPGEPPAIDTSNYISSIRHERISPTTWAVFTDVSYGPELEFGGETYSPRPHWIPTTEKFIPKFFKDMEPAVEKGARP